jgi:peroxiredoxin
MLFYSCDKGISNENYSLIEYNLKNTDKDFLVLLNENGEHKNEFQNKEFEVSHIDTVNVEGNDVYCNLFAREEEITIYIKKGKRLKISFDFNNITETLKFNGDLKYENNYLHKKKLSQRKLKKKNVMLLNEEEFSIKLKRFKEYLFELLKTDNISKNFKENEKKEIIHYIAIQKLLYPQAHSHLTGNKNFAVSTKFYNDFKLINFTDSINYLYSQTLNYANLVKHYFNKIAEDKKHLHDKDEVLSFLKEVDNKLPNGKMKDDLFNFKLRFGLTRKNKIDAIYKVYINAVQNKKDVENLTNHYLSLKQLKKGESAPEFNLESDSGEFISLKDLKGKYLYIDVWATWCAPCKKEFPALKKAINKFKDVQFISISIDKKSQFLKWKNTIKEENLKGLQLIAYNNSTFQEDYAIGSIPRFILIDKEGKIISANAPSPNSSNFNKILNSLK